LVVSDVFTTFVPLTHAIRSHRRNDGHHSTLLYIVVEYYASTAKWHANGCHPDIKLFLRSDRMC